jgi:hypothetical protein
MLSTGNPFTEVDLKKALSVSDEVQRKERRKAQSNL